VYYSLPSLVLHGPLLDCARLVREYCTVLLSVHVDGMFSSTLFKSQIIEFFEAQIAIDTVLADINL
jgi:hypothetical protein